MKKHRKELFHKNVADAFDYDGAISPSFKRPRIRDNFLLSWKDSVKTALILVLSVALSELLRELHVGDQNLILVYILSVVIISRITHGYVYGIIAAILSVFVFDFLITYPRFGFSIIQPTYPITFVIMLIVSLIISTLTMRIKAQALIAVEKEHRTRILYEFNRKLNATRGFDSIIELANAYISTLLCRSVIYYSGDPSGEDSGTVKLFGENVGPDIFAAADDQKAAYWTYSNRISSGAGTALFPGANAYYMSVGSQNKAMGVLGISCKEGIPLNESNVTLLGMFASQLAMALELQMLTDEQARILLDSEKEKMRSNLLRAISHDLRTPLTGIYGASSVILDRGDKMNEQTRNSLISDIKEDSQWLIRMVENLLSVTRIHKETMHVSKQPEAVEEIVGEAIAKTRKRFENRAIVVKVPDELLIVPMDAMLIIQVLLNLMENAIKNSDESTTIHVNVHKQDNLAVFEVIDSGTGISEQNIQGLFKGEILYGNKSADFSRGMGIGLSICSSIVRAHDGRMEAVNRPEGGAVFRFVLPITNEPKEG